MSGKERCGEPTQKGTPCQIPANVCPHHDDRRVGRPTKYDAAFCGRVVTMGRDGLTVAEIAAELDVSKQTLYNWQEEHPEFLDAMTRARDLAEAWWARQGKAGIWSRDFNANAYRLQMMNRFGWGEKSSHDHQGKVDTGGSSIHVYLPHNGRDKLPDAVRDRMAPSTNGSG